MESFPQLINQQTNANNSGKASVFLGVAAAMFFHSVDVCLQRNIMLVD